MESKRASSRDLYTVSEVARRAHITVRALHHYDEIGLLVPSHRSQAGYRLYGQEELGRLREILLFRQLGFSLEAVATLLDEPPAQRRRALIEQRHVLKQQLASTRATIRALDATLDALEGEEAMSADEMFNGFEDLDPEAYREEAQQRWGHTEAYKESARRTKRYGPQDWQRIKEEMEAIESGLATLLQAGEKPEGEAAMDLAERARLHIDRWFYPCTHSMHEALADMYIADERFTAHYERRAEGLAAFVAAAIHANAARSVP